MAVSLVCAVQSLPFPDFVSFVVTDCLKQTVRAEGFRGLWRGFGACCMQAVPSNAAGFLAYELTQLLLAPRESSESAAPVRKADKEAVRRIEEQWLSPQHRVA